MCSEALSFRVQTFWAQGLEFDGGVVDRLRFGCSLCKPYGNPEPQLSEGIADPRYELRKIRGPPKLKFRHEA